MLKKIRTFKKFAQQRKYSSLLLILTTVVLLATSITPFIQPEEEIPVRSEPAVSIGCNEVVWKGTEIELHASTSNIDEPEFNWMIDGKIAGNTRALKQILDPGSHQIILNVSFGGQEIQKKKTVIVIDSKDSLSVRDLQASNNQWKFQTQYNKKSMGVNDVEFFIDSFKAEKVNRCGYFATKGLLAGEHNWRAEYHGETIASGIFKLEEINEIKISGIQVANSYLAGDTVNGKIILKNTGSTVVNGFDIKTNVINHKFEWMGDVAKKEFYRKYDSNVKPGEDHVISIHVKIPEKVNGVKPSGTYSITISLILDSKIVDSRSVKTEVK